MSSLLEGLYDDVGPLAGLWIQLLDPKPPICVTIMLVVTGVPVVISD